MEVRHKLLESCSTFIIPDIPKLAPPEAQEATDGKLSLGKNNQVTFSPIPVTFTLSQVYFLGSRFNQVSGTNLIRDTWDLP